MKASITALLLASALAAMGADPGMPRIEGAGTHTRLIVDGRPFIMLAGELHNSSSSSLEYLEPVWPRLEALNLNTVIASASWELVEPEEGHFDFKLVDGIIKAAREHHLKLVFIWFATWKNANGTYVPAWVKTNWTRFPRCQHRPGIDTTQLTAFSEANRDADARAFGALMRHIKHVDGQEHTVLMMQVENESGVMPTSRDHCALAEKAFAGEVPPALMRYLVAHKATLLPTVKGAWAESGFRQTGTWRQVFGDGPETDEIFQAWYIGSYIGAVAAAGKAQYPLPMYANAWLVQSKGQAPGQYPSGGPVAKMLDIWRAAAPSIDLLAPDIYLEDFKGVCAEYTQSGNPLFIPEARRDDSAGLRAMYAIGHDHALGFSPFGIDSLNATNVLGEYYAVLQDLLPAISGHLESGSIEGFLQQGDSKRAQLDIGGFRAEIEYGSDANTRPGGGLVVALAPDTFLITGANFSIRFGSRPETPGNTAWLSVEELVPAGGEEPSPGLGESLVRSACPALRLGRRLNGDEASYRVYLGPHPRILLGRVYRFE